MTMLRILVLYVFFTSALAIHFPVIFVPGDGGSQLEAKLDKPKKNGDDCPTKQDWFRLWLDVSQLATRWRLQCWSNNIKLVYDPKRNASFNVDGVSTRVPGWGSTDSVEYIDPSWTAFLLQDAGNYAATLVKHLVNKLGYRRGVDVRAAPFDFRFAPDDAFFGKMKTLVEETAKANSKPVVIVTHSLGGLFAHAFLIRQSPDWKRRYVRAFVPLGAPWAGSAETITLYAAGYNLGIPLIDPSIIREEQRSYETGVLLLPSKNLWGRKNAVFLRTPVKNYTASNYDDFFADLHYPTGKINHDKVKHFTEELPFPGVDVHCFFSLGVKTRNQIVYNSFQSFQAGNQPDQVINADGDGTVGIESSQACFRWIQRSQRKQTDQQQPRAFIKQFVGIEHSNLLKDERIFQYLDKILDDQNVR